MRPSFTACYLINRMPTPVLNNDTPIYRLLKIQRNYDFLHTFGCAYWPSIRKYNAHKLSFHSMMCVFLGYSPMHKGYKCLDRSTGRIYISHDVIYDESVFPYSTLVFLSMCPLLRRPSLVHPMNRLRMYLCEIMTCHICPLTHQSQEVLLLCRTLR